MSRIYEGYVYVYPYAGDDVFLHPERIDLRSLPFKERIEALQKLHSEALSGKGLSLLHLLEDLEGKRVRVSVESRRIVIEILD